MNDELLMRAAREYGTPSYVFDLDAFKERIETVSGYFRGRAEICYAMKANPFLTGAVCGMSAGYEVCSPGEYAICKRAGIPADSIVLSGVNKEAQDICHVMDTGGAAVYTAESERQLSLLESCAAARSIQIPVLMRLTSGNQFGMDEETILKHAMRPLNYPHLYIRGIQYYSGTQKKKTEPILKELAQLDEFCCRIESETGLTLHTLEFGPGLYTPYFQGEAAYPEENVLADLSRAIENLRFKGNVVLEMGRFLAAGCGYYLTRIADCKTNSGQNYCIVDGGIHQLNYYGQTMAMKLPFIRHLPQSPAGDGKGPSPCTVCGSLCTTADVIVKQLPLIHPRPGDLLVFEKTGAYSVTEGISLFLSRSLPPVLLYSRQRGMFQAREAYPTDLLNAPRQTAQAVPHEL